MPTANTKGTPMRVWNIDGFHAQLFKVLPPRYDGDGTLVLYTLCHRGDAFLSVNAREGAHSQGQTFFKKEDDTLKEAYIQKNRALRRRTDEWADGANYRRMNFADLLIDLYNWAPIETPERERNALPAALHVEGARLGMVYELSPDQNKKSRFKLREWFTLKPDERLETHPAFIQTALDPLRHLYLLEQRNGTLKELPMHAETSCRQEVTEMKRLRHELFKEFEKAEGSAEWGPAFASDVAALLDNMVADDLCKPYGAIHVPFSGSEEEKLNAVMKKHFPTLSWSINQTSSGSPEDGMDLFLVPLDEPNAEIGSYYVDYQAGITFDFSPKPASLTRKDWLLIRLLVVQFATLCHRTATPAEKIRAAEERLSEILADKAISDMDREAGEALSHRQNQEGWDEDLPFELFH